MGLGFVGDLLAGATSYRPSASFSSSVDSEEPRRPWPPASQAN